MRVGSQNGQASPVRVALLWVCLGIAGLLGWSASWRSDPPTAAAAVDPEAQFGVTIQGVRLSANGHILDFRYRVLDADKALPLVDRTIKAYLVHQPTGAALAVPESPTIGPLRQTEKFGKPQQGRTYVVLFGNVGKLVQEGDHVTVVIGKFRVPDLVVH
jgi:hypothetical protein